MPLGVIKTDIVIEVASGASSNDFGALEQPVTPNRIQMAHTNREHLLPIQLI